MRHGHKAHVVEVERMSRHSVCQCCIRRAGATRCAEYTAPSTTVHHAADDSCRGFDGAGESDADRVAHSRGGPLPRGIRWPRVDDEFRDEGNETPGRNSHGICPSLIPLIPPDARSTSRWSQIRKPETAQLPVGRVDWVQPKCAAAPVLSQGLRARARLDPETLVIFNGHAGAAIAAVVTGGSPCS